MNYLHLKRAAVTNRKFYGYKKNASGYPIILTDCMADYPIKLSVSGNTGKVGKRTSNLFDISQVSRNNITVKDNKIYMNGYANTTNITPEMFLAMTGLKVGDKFTTNRQFENVDGVPSQSATGKICFLNKNGIAFYIYATGVTSRTIPKDFTNANYYNMYVYGISGHSATMSQIQIVSGLYTSATLPEYEPYGNKISVMLGDRELPIYHNSLLDETEAIDLDFKNHLAILTQGEITTDISDKVNWDAVPELPRGSATITVDSEVEPSGMSITYYADGKYRI